MDKYINAVSIEQPIISFLLLNSNLITVTCDRNKNKYNINACYFFSGVSPHGSLNVLQLNIHSGVLPQIYGGKVKFSYLKNGKTCNVVS